MIASEVSAPADTTAIGPSWQSNLLAFGLVILIVLGYFYRQAGQTEERFLARAAEQSRLLSAMITFSANNAVSSQAALEATLHSLLSSSARFVDYLDSVEPFSAAELGAYAHEANLAGIRIVRAAGDAVSGPEGWAPATNDCQAVGTLRSLPDRNLYLLAWRGQSGNDCVQVGFDASGVKQLVDTIGLTRLISEMNHLPMIRYVRLVAAAPGGSSHQDPAVTLRPDGDTAVAETSMAFQGGELVIGIDASQYAQTVAHLWREFLLISLLLALLGTGVSWLLYRYQTTFFLRAREFERQLARQHEEAALGRATATISHEIKNPLNAIGMGLQRLQLEVEMGEEYRGLLRSMRQALARTSAIVTDLKRHAQPIAPCLTPCSLHELVTAAVGLYQPAGDRQGIVIRYAASFHEAIPLDRELLSQVIENLLKNAIEAQPQGGEVAIQLDRQGEYAALTMENQGLTVGADEVRHFATPYFTTKTQGTGLGLAFSQRIVEAHHGRLSIEAPSPRTLRVTLLLPVAPGGTEAGRPPQPATE